MFYSNTFLARKSPLGTVWIAAHLERRIKKHQLDKIDIPSYADCIMFPEVPIALRLSGHLLYGLVRIYSLKVKYLVQDCSRMVDDIRTVFTSVQVNLPVDADHAPFESVTLPNIFDLDAVELDDHMEVPDNHLKTYDQITMQDLIPMEGEQYVSIFIDEDVRVDSSSPHAISTSNRGSGPMEADILPTSEGEVGDQATTNENGVGGGYSGPTHRMEDDVLPPFPFEDEVDDHATPATTVPMDTNVRSHEGNFSNEPPEVLRDAVHGAEQERVDTINDIVGVHEQSVPSTSKNGSLSPIIEGLSVSGEASLPSLPHDKVPTFALADDLDIPNTEISLGQHSADVELQPSPPVNQNVRRKRKKRQFFDETIVLRNTEMKRQVDEPPSNLVCKRRKLPCSALDVWKSTRIHRNDQFFHEPLLCGMSTKLQEVFERKIPSSRSESTSVEEPSMDIEPERPRFGVRDGEISHDLVQSSPAREEFTPSAVPNLGSGSDIGKALEHEELPTFGNPTSAEPTPSVNLEEQLHLDDSNLGEFSTLQNSADIDELMFLEASNTSSGGYDATGVGTMSVMTRKVAQYFKELSPMAHTPEEQSGCISLNKILERKPRKQCARMFFETLVLKSYGFINVQQEEPYGDIVISRTSVLSSMKF